MAYNPENGKRIKDEDGHAKIKWIHKQPYNLKQCLFGLHLTKEDKKKTVAIVESEKTAVIMSMFETDFLWLATGSLKGFKIEYLAPIKLRKIIAFPDKGCFDIWNETAKSLNEKGFKKDFLEKEEKGLFEGKGKNLSGADIHRKRSTCSILNGIEIT